jgi:hypothetical protein
VPEIHAGSAVGRNALRSRPPAQGNGSEGGRRRRDVLGKGATEGVGLLQDLMLSRGGEEAAAPELGNGQRAAEPPAGASLENEDGPDRVRSADLGAGAGPV